MTDDRTHGELSAIDDPLPGSDGSGTVVFGGRTRTYASMLTPRQPRLDTPSVCHPIRRTIMQHLEPCGCDACNPPRRRLTWPHVAAVSFFGGIAVALALFFMAVTPS